MIEIIEQNNNNIYYKCVCGARGLCSIKPMDRDAAIVIDIKCPLCQAVERVTLLQYSSEDSKQDFLDDLDNTDLSWVPTFNEEILDEKEE